MGYGGGHVCILVKIKDLRVPTTVTFSGELLLLLISIWQMKVSLLHI